jgi:hypothetical protein
MDTLEREKEILHTVHYYREAVHIESLHRWYFDVYTNPDNTHTVTPIEDAGKAQAYKFKFDMLPNWRAVLHNAQELNLPLPKSLNLKRYSKV